ncbi:MAG: MFS transporter [Firmicutes bacterium]|nr:MFS transporter [Bacillota bacterium]
MKRKGILLLIIIYISFIALGLPDALLGSSWNLVRVDLSTSLGTLGIMTVIVYIMSILSTFNAPRLLRFLQTRKIVFVSIVFTGISLIVMSRVDTFYQMLFFAIPLGMGAGAIDVSLNHYLAVNYKAQHMNYLHSFYGIGVTLGPTIMAFTLRENSWRLGYVIVGSILLVISVIILFSFPMWKNETEEEREDQHTHITLKEILKTKGSVLSILIFLFYVHIESLGGVWIASYFFIEKNVSYATAALFTTAFFLMFTLGRLLSGVLSIKVNPNTLIKIGEVFMLCAGLLMLIQTSSLWFYFAIVGLFGLGAAPIYPNMMFMNSKNFEKRKLSKMMSLQMAIGYMGFGLLTPLAGLIFDLTTISIYPYFIIGVGVILIFLTRMFMKKIA